MALTLSEDNDYVIDRAMTIMDDATGEIIPALAMTGGIGYISLTDGGNAAHSSLQVALTERTGEPGTYFGILQGNDITTQIAALGLTNGQTVWECVQFDTDYRSYFKAKVKINRVGS